jgi:hypothetical protein
MARVHSREPVQKMKQFFSGPQRIALSNRLSAMNGEIADFFDRLDLQEKIAGEVLLESRFVDEGAQVVVVRSL